MKNKLEKHVKKTEYKWHLIFFLILLVVIHKFLLLKGIWFPIDASYRFPLFSNPYIEFFRTINSFGGLTYLGSDLYQINSSRWVTNFVDILLRFLFGDKWGFIFLLLLFFFSGYYFSFKLSEKLFDSHYVSFLTGLFYVFNPLAIFFISQPGIMLSYSFIPVFLYSITAFVLYRDFSVNNKFTFLLSLLILSSYPRVIGLILSFLAILFIAYWNYFLKFFRESWKKLFVISLLVILVSLPVIDSYLGLFKSSTYSKSAGEDPILYISKENNYLHDISYEIALRKPVHTAVSIGLDEYYDNFSISYSTDKVFRIYSFAYLGFLVLTFFTNFYGEKKYNFVKIVFSILLIINSLAYFIGKDAFMYFTYDIFPFISFSTSWVSLLFILCYCVIVGYNLKLGNYFLRGVTLIGLMLYLLISTRPLVLNKTYMQTLSSNEIPQEYARFFSENSNPISTFFYPTPNVHFSWAPYRQFLYHNNSNISWLDDNVRTTNSHYRDLFNGAIENFNCYFLRNIWLFNIKSIPLFWDTEENSSWRFITPTTSSELNSLLESCGEDLSCFQDGDISLYRPRDYEQWDYLLYSPHKIYFEDSYNVLFGDKLFQKGSLFLNKDANQRIGYAEDDLLNGKELEIKKSRYNRHKFYIRINDVDPSESFFIHLSQTFSSSWKFKWISKEEYDSAPCLDSYTSYNLSNNSYCNYKERVILLDDFKYLRRSEIEEKNHFFGNFSGNTWLVESDKIPSEYKSEDGNLYAVVIYDRQIVFSILLYISVVTLFILLLLTLISSIIKLIRRKNITI